MRLRNQLSVLLFAAACCTGTFGQSSRINMRKANIGKAKNSDEKLAAIFSLCEETESLNKDTLYYYAIEAKKLAQAKKNLPDTRLAAYYEAYALYRRNKLDSIPIIINQYLPQLQKDPSSFNLYASFYLLLARYYSRKQELKDALSSYYKVLNEAEKNKDTLNQMRAMGGVGSVLNRTGDRPGALSWFLTAMRFSDRPLYRNQTSYLYTNAAVIYIRMDKYDSCIYYVQKGIQYARESENLGDLTSALGMYAGALMDKEKFPQAEKALQEALEVSKEIGDPDDIITNMGALGVFYYQSNHMEKGIAICQEAIAMIAKYHVNRKLPYIYDILAENYKWAGKYKEQGETLRQLVEIDDSLYQANSAEAMAELRTKFEVQKKENTIIRQQLDLVKKDYFIYSAILLFLLAVLISYFVFTNYKKRQKLKAALAVSYAEESERKRIAADLHDNLGAYAASIASNVNRLSAQTADAGDASALQEVRNNSNAIVADLSDTIWALKKQVLTLTAVSDRLKVFLQRIQPSYPGILIDVQEDIIKDHLLSPSQGFHLFQTIREAVNNALKHSGGAHIIIYVEGTEKEWKILVTDNGSGMQPLKENSEGGNGLFNMKNRAEEAGWDISWTENKPNGTVVTITQAAG